MAERQPREETLRRVHGPSALFAAAYGNVGSSIYYVLKKATCRVLLTAPMEGKRQFGAGQGPPIAAAGETPPPVGQASH